MGEVINTYEIMVGKPKGKRTLRNLGVDMRIILEWPLRKRVRSCGLIWLRIGTRGGIL
jgi:hypothetical protein